VHKAGPAPLTYDQMVRCIKLASLKVVDLHAIVQSTLNSDAESKRKAKRLQGKIPLDVAPADLSSTPIASGSIDTPMVDTPPSDDKITRIFEGQSSVWGSETVPVKVDASSFPKTVAMEEEKQKGLSCPDDSRKRPLDITFQEPSAPEQCTAEESRAETQSNLKPMSTKSKQQSFSLDAETEELSLTSAIKKERKKR